MRKNKLAILTLALSLSFIALGLPAQILQIWQTKSVEDVSLPMFLLLDAQCIAWVIYGRKQKDWVIITPNLLGVLFATIIIIQFFLFQ